MRHLTIGLLAATLIAGPALAFSVDINLPTLTFPTEPATQSCTDPATLTPACKPGS